MERLQPGVCAGAKSRGKGTLVALGVNSSYSICFKRRSCGVESLDGYDDNEYRGVHWMAYSAS